MDSVIIQRVVPSRRPPPPRGREQYLDLEMEHRDRGNNKTPSTRRSSLSRGRGELLVSLIFASPRLYSPSRFVRNRSSGSSFLNPAKLQSLIASVWTSLAQTGRMVALGIRSQFAASLKLSNQPTAGFLRSDATAICSDRRAALP